MSLVFIEWSQEYLSGNETIDQQHQHLFQIINKLYQSIESGQTKESLIDIFDELIKDTLEHFETEETLMTQKKYMGYYKHKEDHDNLKRQVKKLRAKVEEENEIIDIELLDLLKKWLTDHIREDDLEMTKFL
jgi:hemerythrin